MRSRRWAWRGGVAAILLCTALTGAAGDLDIQVRALYAGKAMLEINGSRVILAEGTTGPAGVHLIRATAQAAVVRVDGERRRLRLTSRVGGAYSAPKTRRIRIRPDERGRYTVNGRLDGEPVRFLVDTGADLVAIDESLAQRIDIPYQTEGTPMRVGTAAGTVNGWRVRLERVRIGEILLRGVPAIVLGGQTLHSPLLGMSFLGRVSLRHDGRTLIIEQRN